jgi:hypothetical protein
MEYALVEIVNIYFESGENACERLHCAGTSEPVGLIGENRTGWNMHPLGCMVQGRVSPWRASKIANAR